MLRLVALCTTIALMELSGAAAPRGVCVERCPDDDVDGHCAPSCDDCVCCSVAPTVLPAPVGAAPVSGAASRPGWRLPQQPLDPDPNAVEHVPIAR